MICPSCGSKLKCQESRPLSHECTRREYGCISCEKVYASIEQLDDVPVDKEIQKRLVKYYKRRKEIGQSVRS